MRWGFMNLHDYLKLHVSERNFKPNKNHLITKFDQNEIGYFENHLMLN